MKASSLNRALDKKKAEIMRKNFGNKIQKP